MITFNFVRVRIVCAAVFALFLLAVGVSAANNEKSGVLAKQAVSINPTESAAAISELRAGGANGLNRLFETYQTEIAAYRAGETVDAAQWAKIAAALDAVSMQKDAYASGLFWHTDFEKAKQAAEKEDKPILSLRLLGNLNEELSCANSRFFRAILYSNSTISQTLREKFVLHWQSVRPAPKVTIDFGDGRKIERTITGNSIHYIVDEDGNLLDALPGLYSPTRFNGWLAESEKNFQTWRKMSKQKRLYFPRYWHRQQLNSLDNTWRAELEKPKPKSVWKPANRRPLSKPGF